VIFEWRDDVIYLIISRERCWDFSRFCSNRLVGRLSAGWCECLYKEGIFEPWEWPSHTTRLDGALVEWLNLYNRRCELKQSHNRRLDPHWRHTVASYSPYAATCSLKLQEPSRYPFTKHKIFLSKLRIYKKPQPKKINTNLTTNRWIFWRFLRNPETSSKPPRPIFPTHVQLTGEDF